MSRSEPAEALMRRWELVGDGRGTLGLATVPVPEPGPAQVVVALRAAALNHRDLSIRTSYRGAPLVPASDGAGDVVAVGSAVSRLRVGDRVVGSFFAGWSDGPARHADLDTALGGDLDGVLAEHFVLAADAAALIPAGLSYAAAATFPCAGVTAWNALVCGDALRPHDTLLTLGTGGVSIFALQIAKLRGARVVATSSADEKLARLTAMGADDVMNYADTPDWDVAVRAVTAGRGVDHVVEVGGAGTLARSLRACAAGGCVTLVGLLDGWPADVDAGLIHGQALTLRSVYVGSRAMLDDVLSGFAGAGLEPVVDRSFPFEEASSAFAYLDSGRHVGKVVVENPGAERGS